MTKLSETDERRGFLCAVVRWGACYFDLDSCTCLVCVYVSQYVCLLSFCQWYPEFLASFFSGATQRNLCYYANRSKRSTPIPPFSSPIILFGFPSHCLLFCKTTNALNKCHKCLHDNSINCIECKSLQPLSWFKGVALCQILTAPPRHRESLRLIIPVSALNADETWIIFLTVLGLHLHSFLPFMSYLVSNSKNKIHIAH